MAEDYLVSDGLPEKEGFKYPLAFCSSSFLADSYYSFKDFVLVIGDNHFQYSYPSRLYNIEWSYFIEHIDSVSLYNRKTDELIKIDEIELKYNSKDSLHFMPGSINAKKELSHRLFADSQLEVWIPPLNYPIDCDFNCGKVSLAFLPIKLQLRD